MSLLGSRWSRPDWRIDPAQPGHARAIAALHAASFARGWSEAEVATLLSDPAVVADRLRAGSRADALDGFAMSRNAAGEAELLSIAVARRWRGRGAGVPLLTRHLGRLAGRGVGRVVLEVDEANAPARALYARFGFAEVGRRPAYYAHADGSRGTALVLARTLG
ncbi:MAG TPA: GNAT family N-acetyltransferase [Hyphomicrobiales bacterium]|nr:GNAT family N-acetyltransferase [Hyphomicrobiales bacterium]